RCSWTVNGYGAAGNAGITIYEKAANPGAVIYLWGAQLTPGTATGAPIVTTSAQIVSSGLIAIAPVLTNPSVQGTLTLNGSAAGTTVNSTNCPLGGSCTVNAA